MLYYSYLQLKSRDKFDKANLLINIIVIEQHFLFRNGDNFYLLIDTNLFNSFAIFQSRTYIIGAKVFAQYVVSS